jgi:hypothetical protein
VTVTTVGKEPVSAKLVVIAADPDGQFVHTASPEQVLTSGQPQIFHSRFMPGRLQGDFTVRLETPDGRFIEQKVRSTANPAGESDFRAGFRQDVPFWGLSGIPHRQMPSRPPGP